MNWPWNRLLPLSWRKNEQFTEADKSKAFFVYLEFGPNKRIPRPKRLMQEFPQLTSSQVNELIAFFVKIDASIYKLAEEGAPRNMPSEEFKKILKTDYPFLDDDSLGRSWAVATYYAAHEGFIAGKADSIQ